MIRFDDILDKIASRFSEKDVTFLQKAYVFTARAHGGQVRRMQPEFVDPRFHPR